MKISQSKLDQLVDNIRDLDDNYRMQEAEGYFNLTDRITFLTVERDLAEDILLKVEFLYTNFHFFDMEMKYEMIGNNEPEICHEEDILEWVMIVKGFLNELNEKISDLKNSYNTGKMKNENIIKKKQDKPQPNKEAILKKNCTFLILKHLAIEKLYDKNISTIAIVTNTLNKIGGDNTRQDANKPPSKETYEIALKFVNKLQEEFTKEIEKFKD